MRAKVFTLRIHLIDSAPEIWRQIEVDSRITMQSLHFAIQIVMNWENDHMHLFTKGDKNIGVPTSDPWGPKLIDERETRLAELVTRKGSHLEYEYDFGDSWIHRIEVKATRAHDQEEHFPVTFIDGDRACPPEDFGGIYRYNDLVECGLTTDHQDYDDLIEWLGDDFDPEFFDKDWVIERLKKYASHFQV